MPANPKTVHRVFQDEKWHPKGAYTVHLTDQHEKPTEEQQVI